MRVLLFAMLVGCGGASGKWSVDYNEFPRADAELERTLAVALDSGLSVCPPDRRDALKAVWGGHIEFMPNPFACAGGEANYTGCWVGSEFYVGHVAPLWKSALIDEVGHLVWETCFDNSGEETTVDRSVYREDFRQWVSNTREAVRGEP